MKEPRMFISRRRPRATPWPFNDAASQPIRQLSHDLIDCSGIQVSIFGRDAPVFHRHPNELGIEAAIHVVPVVLELTLRSPVILLVQYIDFLAALRRRILDLGLKNDETSVVCRYKRLDSLDQRMRQV